MRKPVASPLPQPLEQEKVNILVVDDLPEKHLVFRSILEELGQNIVSARSGEEALRYILEMEFAVILLDVNMPDIDGLETAGLIRQYKKSAQTPIIFITAYADEVQAERGYALGRGRLHPVAGRARGAALQGEGVRRAVPHEPPAAGAGGGSARRWRAPRPRGRPPKKPSSGPTTCPKPSQRLSRSLNIEDTIARPVRRGGADAGRPGRAGAGQRRRHAGAGGKPSRRRRAARPSRCPTACAQRWRAPSRAGSSNSGARATRPRPSARCWPAAERRRRAGPVRRRASAWTRRALALAKEVVSRASIAMENARLYTAVQEADRRKNEFLAMLAHELRNPLAPIRNAVHIMQGGDVTQLTMNWARDVIGRQADHMARLIDDLLDVSRIVQGKVVVKPEKLSLAVAGGALAWKAARRAWPAATRC